ncbi:MAG: phosphonate ABC transporter, permease protein PhnE [Chloroflexota bacterium]|nr:phosphonate ABC transporter, permease protein PhnE [Chloroflexota bacterium]
MAIIEKPAVTPDARAGALRSTPPPPAPARRPKPFFLRSWFSTLLFVALAAGLVFGWKQSEIDLPLLVQKSPNIGRFISDIFHPDIISHDQAKIELAASSILGVAKPDPGAKPVQAADTLVPSISAGQTVRTDVTVSDSYTVTLSISADAVAPGQELTLTGSGFRPSTAGKVLWRSTGQSASVQDLGLFVSDAKGSFTSKVSVPSDPDRVINSSGFPNTIAVDQTWDYGTPYLSPTVGLIKDKMIETIFTALMGTAFAVIFSIPISFLAARNLMGHTIIGNTVYTLARTLLNTLRSIEVLILAVVFAATVGLGPFAGVLSLVVYSTASLGKLFSEAIESIDPGPIEALTATGASRLQVINYAVIPQFIPQFLSFTLYTWDRNVRMSTVIGFVGGGGVGFILLQFINLLQWNQAGTALLAIALVVIAIDWASSRIRAAVI